MTKGSSNLRKSCFFTWRQYTVDCWRQCYMSAPYSIQAAGGDQGPPMTAQSLVVDVFLHLHLDIWRTMYWTLYWFAKILEKLSILFDPKATASSYLSRLYFPRYSPQQEARCRSRIVSFWSLGHLWRTSHTPQTSGSAGTNPSLHPQQCPLGSAGPPGATCGHHTPGRAGLGLVSG